MAHYTLETKDTVPSSASITGTVTATAGNKTLTGSGTNFFADCTNSGYIYDATNNELRQIDRINTATELVLKSGFTNALSGATVKHVNANKRNVSIYANGADIVTYDAFGNTSEVTNGTKLDLVADAIKAVQPIIVVGVSSAASAVITTTP